MLEAEIQKLTAAIEALTAELRSAKAGNLLPTETPTNLDKPRQKKEKPAPVTEEIPKLPEPANIAAIIDPPDLAITQDTLKTVAMEIARADSSARPIILEILGEHGAKTITQLDPKHYHAVHGRLLSLAFDIAKNGEPV